MTAKRKIKITALRCPIHRDNCLACMFSLGTENNFVYCDYSNPKKK